MPNLIDQIRNELGAQSTADNAGFGLRQALAPILDQLEAELSSGGPQAIRTVYKTFSFDTPGLLDGLPLTTLAPGESLFTVEEGRQASHVRLTTSWNGTGPLVQVGRTKDEVINDGNYFLQADATYGVGDIFGDGSLFVVQVNQGMYFITPGGDFGSPWVTVPTELVYFVSQSDGSDPGATQGEATIVVVILTAPTS